MISNTSTRNYQYSLVVNCFVIAALAAPLSIILHELVHYLTAMVMGASDVNFHWAYVSHDSESTSDIANAFIALLGPFSSYLMALIAYKYSRKTTSLFFLAFGLSASLRSLVVVPYTIKTLLGKDTSTFYFDEIRGANALDVSPLLFVTISLIVGLIGFIYFSTKIHSRHNIFLTLTMIMGVISGIFAWSIFGSMLFPGGHGLN